MMIYRPPKKSINFSGDQWKRKPLLVTGAPRSGTTWVGRMLTASGEFHYIHEPFNPDHPFDIQIFKLKMPRYMMYVTDELRNYNASYFKPMKNIVEGKCSYFVQISRSKNLKALRYSYKKIKEYKIYKKLHIPPLLKDPIAIMSAGWLAKTYGLDVIILIRHPAAVIASMKRLGWTFEPKNWALSQPLLIRDYLHPYEAELKEVLNTRRESIERLAMLWKIVYYVVLKYKEEHPDWFFIKHEDLAKEPFLNFGELYNKLGLNFSERAKNTIEEFSSIKNPKFSHGKKKGLRLNSQATISNWKKMLSENEVKIIKKIVEDISKYYYGEHEW